jgi:hypothetical protein
VTNRNFLSFVLRKWDRTDAAIAFAFEQKAGVFLVRLLRGTNGVSDALGDFRNIGLTERGDRNRLPIAVDGHRFECGVLRKGLGD